jgi:hypothetical protein
MFNVGGGNVCETRRMHIGRLECALLTADDPETAPWSSYAPPSGSPANVVIPTPYGIARLTLAR